MCLANIRINKQVPIFKLEALEVSFECSLNFGAHSIPTLDVFSVLIRAN